MNSFTFLLSVFLLYDCWGRIYTQSGDGVDPVDNDEDFEIASEAYIYFYPVLHTTVEFYFHAIWPHAGTFHAMNNFNYVTQPVDWTYTVPSDPSVDDLYSKVFLDLENPIVLSIPDIPQKRYYSVTIYDCYMISIKTISPRTRGGSWAADQFVIVGPGFRGSLPSHFDDDHIVRSLCRFASVLVRIAVYDSDDVPIVMEIQDGYTLVSLVGNEPQKTNVPVFPFVDRQVIDKPVPEAQVFFSLANFIINYVEIEDYETCLFRRFAKIDVGPSKEFIGQEMSQQMYRNIQDGIANGSKKKDDALASEVVVKGWTDKYQTKTVHDNDYLGRAAIASLGAYFIDPEEALYHYAWEDVDGIPLDSTKYDYTLTFSPSQFPPVVEAYAGYWTITAYLESWPNLGTLVHNPIDRYAISPATTPGLVYDTDGGLTLYVQKTRPDTDAKAANWLPTPDPEFGGYEMGDFHLLMRQYVPESTDYYPPGIMRAGTAAS